MNSEGNRGALIGGADLIKPFQHEWLRKIDLSDSNSLQKISLQDYKCPRT